MEHSRAPVLEALQAYREQGFTPFNPSGHRQGRGADPRVLELLGEDVFAAVVISVNGLDDRTMEVLDCVRSGIAAGRHVPDPGDPELGSVRVVAW